MSFDVVIEHGKVVDGTGSSWFEGDVGIVGDRIDTIGKLDKAEAARRIDARGKVVCPGFIDVHVHSELAILTGEAALPRLTQGVTTDLLAPDGLSYAPLSQQRLHETRDYLAIFYGTPDIGWDWSTHAEYLERYHKRCALNVVPQVAYNAIRAEVVGWEGRPATEDELEKMKDMTRQVMEDGATGIQTGLEYYPSAHGTTHELIELCKVVREYGGVYSSHIRGYGVHFEKSSNEVFELAEAADIPVHFSHLFGKPEFYAPLEAARERGIDVTFDAYPYMAGSTHLVYCFPKWVQTGTPDEVRARLSDPAERDKYRPQMNNFFIDRGYATDDVVFSSIGPAGEHELLGTSLTTAVEESGKDLTDFTSDLLVQNELQVLMVFHWHDESMLKAALTHPYHMVCSDGIFKQGRPHPRGYGTFPRFISLTTKKGWLTMEEAVRHMTSFPATRYGLQDRGIIRSGMAADVVVFDEESLEDKATFEKGMELCVGIETVLVNGQIALDDGKLANTTAGQVVGRS